MIVLTGGAGFIGSCFLAKLNDEGVSDIIVVDELGKEDKWKNLVGKNFLDFIHKDEFLALVESDNLPENIETVIHLGACSSTTERDADFMVHNNYRYSVQLASWALENRARLIYASSAAVYGDGRSGFSDDPHLTSSYHPLNVYAYSKQLFDTWILKNKLHDSVVGLRYFNVYGPNEYHKEDMTSVVFKAFHQISNTGKLQLFKSYRKDFADGEQKRDFVYVKDSNEVLWWLCNNTNVCGLLNIGSGTARSWNDLARSVFAAMNRELKIEYIDMPVAIRDRYQYFTEAPLKTLRSAGYNQEFISLESGVGDYLKEHLSQSTPYL